MTADELHNMRSLNILLLALVAGSVLSHGQSLPDKGTVTGNLYTNKSLGLTWYIPTGWQIQNNAGPAPAHTQFLLEVLPGGAQSGESVAIIGLDHDHFNEASPPPVSGKAWLPLPKQNNDPELSDLTLGNGLPVHRYDFKSLQDPVRYLTFLSGPRKGYGVDFVILANSASNLEEIIHVLVEMKIQPDWPENAPPIAGHLQSSDQTPKTVQISGKKANASKLKRSVAPEYPLQAREGGVQGVVKLLGHIGKDGKIENLYLLSGPPLLCRPAIAAVSQWRYQPYLAQGEPVEVETSFDIIFQLAN